MGNKLGTELGTGHFMLEAIRKDDEALVKKALDIAHKERIMSREDERQQGVTSEQMTVLKNKALLDYFSRKWNCEGTYFKGNINKMNFVEFAYSLGFSLRGRQVQKMWDAQRELMGLETDPIEIRAAAESNGFVPREAGTRGLSSTGKEAKSNLEAWVAKRNASKQPSDSTNLMNKLKTGGA